MMNDSIWFTTQIEVISLLLVNFVCSHKETKVTLLKQTKKKGKRPCFIEWD